MEIMALGGITLIQGLSLLHKEQRRSGILTSASGLIKDEQVEDLRESEQTALGIRLATVCRGKTLRTGSS